MKNKKVKIVIFAIISLLFATSAYAATCPNRICEVGEDYRNCPQDCPQINSQPQIISQPITDAVVGQSYTYWVEATDVDGDNVEFGLGKRPQGMQVRNSKIVPNGDAYRVQDYGNKGEIMWIPEESQSISPNNIHEVEVIANDMKGFQTSISEKQTFKIRVRMPSICGNNIKEEGEICDGSDFGEKSCSSEGFLGGELKCSQDCKNSLTDSCFTHLCGNNQCEPEEDYSNCPQDCKPQCKDITPQIKECVDGGGQDVTSLDNAGCLVFNECKKVSEIKIKFIKIQKGVIVQIKDSDSNTDPLQQEKMEFNLRVDLETFKVDAVEDDLNSGVFEAQIKFRRSNLLSGFFYLITGLFTGTPVTYLEVFEGEKLIVSYKGVTAEYLIEDGIPTCSQEYLAQAQICEKQGNTPIIEVNKDGCKELVRCEAACPDIREEINQCINKEGNTIFGRDKNNCTTILECKISPTTEQPRSIPPEIIDLGLTLPSNIYCSFEKLEKENLKLIEVNNVKITEKMAQGSKIEYDLTNKGYLKSEYVVSINAYNTNSEEFLSAFNTFNNKPSNGETNRIGTQHFLKNNVKNQKLVFEIIGIDGKLIGYNEVELQVN